MQIFCVVCIVLRRFASFCVSLPLALNKYTTVRDSGEDREVEGFFGYFFWIFLDFFYRNFFSGGGVGFFGGRIFVSVLCVLVYDSKRFNIQ